MNTKISLLSKCALSMGVFALTMGQTAHAAIGGGAVDSVHGGARPELLLVVVDTVTKVQYTQDLGMYANWYDPAASVADHQDNFFVYAQQDAGYQKFFPALNTDKNFGLFLAASSGAANLQWGVYASNTPGIGQSPGEINFFTTIQSKTVDDGKVNGEWQSLKDYSNQKLQDLAGVFASAFVDSLNLGYNQFGAGAGNPNNSHYNGANGRYDPNFALNGSSYDVKGGLVNQTTSDAVLANGRLAQIGPQTWNPVGSSSWFYWMTTSSDGGDDKVVLDEFDNLNHDGYWGLAVDGQGQYILSFTMEAAITPTSTVLGLQRRNLSEFSALYGDARKISLSFDEFANWTPKSSVDVGSFDVSAVPEPSSYGLMGLGLALLGARLRRRRQGGTAN